MLMKTCPRTAAPTELEAAMSQARKQTYSKASVMVIPMPETGGRPPGRLMRPLSTERSNSWPVGIGARQQTVQHKPQSRMQPHSPADHVPSTSVFLSGVLSAIAGQSTGLLRQALSSVSFRKPKIVSPWLAAGTHQHHSFPSHQFPNSNQISHHFPNAPPTLTFYCELQENVVILSQSVRFLLSFFSANRRSRTDRQQTNAPMRPKRMEAVRGSKRQRRSEHASCLIIIPQFA